MSEQSACCRSEEVVELQTKMENLYGNGRPGRVTNLEENVRGLCSKVDSFMGALKVWGIVASATWALLMALLVAHLTGHLA